MFVVELFPVNDLRELDSNDHFPSFVSKSFLVPLTAPLMDLRIMLSALKCITINVIRDTCRMVCLLGGAHGTGEKEGINTVNGWKQESCWKYQFPKNQFLGKYYYSGDRIIVECPLTRPQQIQPVMQLVDGYRTQGLTDFEGVKVVIKDINRE